VRFVDVDSPLSPGAPVRVGVREAGSGPALVILHSGWGWEPYPFDRAFERLAPWHRVVAPDRTGYGASPPLPGTDLPLDYHRGYALETLRVMDGLGIERAAVWGHSDGAVVAAWMAIEAPERVRAAILEAFHHRRAKVASLPFFETGATAPERFGPEIEAALRRDHGDPRWREIVGAGARAWLRIIRDGTRTGGDLYDGRLAGVRCPVLFLHGSRDPRTEPGEIEEALAQVPDGRLALLDTGHSPHSAPRCGADAVEAAARFLEALPP
jgi:pimeloyl-ACP methyl ester carboxylesterase